MAKRVGPVRIEVESGDAEALSAAAAKAGKRGKDPLIVLEGAGPDELSRLVKALAESRGLVLQTVDLSLLMSKGVGETGKKLKAIFAEADAAKMALFFDEADALFGRRGAVKDSHDRYANLEVSFLKAVKRHKGPVCLAVDQPAGPGAKLSRAADVVVALRARDERAAARRPRWDEPLSNRHFLVFIGDLEIGFCSVGGLGDAEDDGTDGESSRLVLRRALSRSKDLYHWRRAQRDGKDAVRSIELWQLAEPGRRPVNRWRFTGCRPLRWRGPSFDAIGGELAFEEIEIRYDDVEWL